MLGTNAATLEALLGVVTDAAARNTHMYGNAAKLGHKTALSCRSARHVGRYGPDDAEPLTHFHSGATPNFGIESMYRLVGDRSPAFDDDTGLIAVTLMLRYQRMTGLPITTAMLHRLFITAVLVASKSHHDCGGVRTGAVARRFGIALREMCLMERCFLESLDFRVLVFAADVKDACAELSAVVSGRVALTRELRRPRARDDPLISHPVCSPESASYNPFRPAASLSLSLSLSHDRPGPDAVHHAVAKWVAATQRPTVAPAASAAPPRAGGNASRRPSFEAPA